MLVNADSRWIPLQNETVQLIVTSIPYFNAREEYARWNNYPDYLSDMLSVWKDCYRVLCDGGRIAVNVVEGYGRTGNGRDGYVPLGHLIAQDIRGVGFTLRGIVIWNKTHHVMGTAWGSWKSATNPCLRDQHELIIIAHKGSAAREGSESTIDADTFLKATSSIWVIPPAQSDWHPAPFPAEIPRRLIELYSFKGDTVLDPFVGSGTTVFVANKLGRVGIGIDRKWSYLERVRCEVALQEGDWELSQELARRVAAQDAQPLEELPMFAEM